MPHEITEEHLDGGLVLTLRVEGELVATARASADVLDQMKAQWGTTSESVAGELRTALERYHADALEKVTIDAFHEAPERSRRFVATFTFKDFRNVAKGIAWYDMRTGETGPADVPALVRNKLRYVVHDLLTADDPTAKELRRILR